MSKDFSQRNNPTFASQPSERKIEKVRQIAAKITVKISNQESLGSGIIIQKQDNRHLVITNQHVLRAGEEPYQIQTFDGKIHLATVIPTQASSRYDIALLEFSTHRDNYQAVSMGNSAALTVGEPVFAVGFPDQDQEINSASSKELSHNRLTELTFTKGRISVILDQTLEEGYQIGYTNEVIKGMSGGALLNIQGLLIGVNGKHAYPLWEAPDFFEDQSQPCPPLQELIIRSSLAIPLENIMNAAPEVSWQSLPDTKISSDQQNWLSIPIDATEKNPEELITKMQVEAAQSKRCEE